MSNYLIFDKQFITYTVILYNHNSFTEIKKKLTPLNVLKCTCLLCIPYHLLRPRDDLVQLLWLASELESHTQYFEFFHIISAPTYSVGFYNSFTDIRLPDMHVDGLKVHFYTILFLPDHCSARWPIKSIPE